MLSSSEEEGERGGERGKKRIVVGFVDGFDVFFQGSTRMILDTFLEIMGRDGDSVLMSAEVEREGIGDPKWRSIEDMNDLREGKGGYPEMKVVPGKLICVCEREREGIFFS